mmetsp:Transcript_23789/g.67263  ORF Transcript_23789/g.67263 Transcript_23789/m.67263 type:complete len:308 (-) Transcript_23789:179-1102(-)|eukprot:CAMPEP_0119565354 /NCGR_PEP_ID=MMETSP1352-20130426/29755_1 /TAXON_ID=265584 /ORGANISM="Stauroneis constricta, Strain CCMP1120" /LENGTH=307 /DNA_ID=CAMNT_0007614243 /DNA_START=45 /DNA_END=968 /DNA_ORIENTATION=-
MTTFLHSTSLFASSAVVTLGIQLTGFAFAYALQTETFYDVLGGVNFLALGVGSYLLSEDTPKDLQFATPSTLATTFFVISRSWLLIFLAWRAHSRKGDSRFDEVKTKFGLFLVYWLVQGMWVYLISTPIIYINNSSTDSMAVWQWIALAGFAVGIFTEIIADIQKAVWVENGRVGTFCTVGLWKYSRHPNYFGEIFQWWCCWILAAGSAFGNDANGKIWVWAVCSLSPLFTMHILLNLPGTGISNAEGKNLKRYYENPECRERYKEYRRTTSNLIPMVGYGAIPLSIKRVFFFEWERYEYRESNKTE